MMRRISCIRLLQRRPGPAASSGFNLLELAVALAIIGLVALLGNSMMTSFSKGRKHVDLAESVEVVRQSLLTYLLRNKHLPCPDLTGTGYPGDTSGNCPSSADIGYLPYAVLGLSSPRPGEDLDSRIVYGVFRSSNQADLVRPTKAPGDELDADASGAFIHTLVNAAKLPVSSQRPYVTGPHDPFSTGMAGAKPENCNVAASNPAFVLAAPGTPVAGAHVRRGGVNASLLDAGSKCFAAPDRKPQPDYGDVVHAESKFELLGWYVTQAR